MDAKRAVVMSVGVLGLVALLVHAGPLDPPAGPVAPTDKPLGEIESRTVVNATNTPGDTDSAFIIDQRGSYYLTENIGGFEDNQILITASNVTLDLNGFTLTGSPSFQNYGIRVEGSQVTIRNGHVRGYGPRGDHRPGRHGRARRGRELVVQRSRVGPVRARHGDPDRRVGRGRALHDEQQPGGRDHRGGRGRASSTAS